jgi:DNA-binding SARP family transcriptional activator
MQENRLADAMLLYQEALAVWRGEPLGGTASRLLDSAVIGLTERRLSAAESYADVCLRLHEHQNLVEDLRLLTAAHPLRETLHVRLMRVLAQAGRSAEAIEAYRAARHTFVDELGLEPGKELRQLRSAIIASRQEVEQTAYSSA